MSVCLLLSPGFFCLSVFLYVCLKSICIIYISVRLPVCQFVRLSAKKEVGIYKRKILGEKVRKYVFDHERKVRFKEKERKHDLGQENRKENAILTKKKTTFKILLFSFIDSHLCSSVCISVCLSICISVCLPVLP